MPEAAKVKGVFASIASSYDLANRVISCGQDLRWRAQVVRMVAERKPEVVADLATGSGDMAFALCRKLPKETSITALDFCEPMLDEARRKQTARPWSSRIHFAQGDCTAMNFPSESMDVLTIGWGLRNFEDRAKGLREMRRVLRPGGALYCLEFSQPYKWLRGPYYLYLKHVMPFLARIITGQRGSYEYLVDTVGAFPGREALAQEMLDAGFSRVNTMPRFFSIVAIHEAIR